MTPSSNRTTVTKWILTFLGYELAYAIAFPFFYSRWFQDLRAPIDLLPIDVVLFFAVMPLVSTWATIRARRL